MTGPATVPAAPAPGLLSQALAYLVAGLGPGVPVLLPEQGRAPLQEGPRDALGRPVGARQGVGHYLGQHPGGYVQLEALDAVAVRADVLGVWYGNVYAYAATRAEAEALAARALRALCRTRAQPTPFRPVFPPASAEAVAGLDGWRCAVTVQYTRNLGRNDT